MPKKEQKASKTLKDRVVRMLDDGYRPVMYLHRDDIEGMGFDTSNMDNAEISDFASDVGESLMELFHVSVETLADEKYDLPRQ
jgi:methylaspartate ammonia-lyase